MTKHIARYARFSTPRQKAGRVKSAATYVRVAAVRQNDEAEIQAQPREVITYCQQRGWTVVANYVDAGASGMSEDRIGLQRLLRDAEGGSPRFNVLVVKDHDRLFRSSALREIYRYRLQNAGVEVVSVH